MAKELFDNVGRGLKELANGIYTSHMIGYVLAALGIFAASIVLAGDYVMIACLGFVIGIGILFVGHSKAKLAVMKLYAYGELVERVMSIESKLSNAKNAKPVAIGGSKTNSGKESNVSVETESDASDQLPITDRNPDGSWVCIFCDTKNVAGARKCRKCETFARFE